MNKGLQLLLKQICGTQMSDNTFLIFILCRNKMCNLTWLTCLISLLFLLSGSRSGTIHHHDVRVANHHVATLARHTQEVCGLKWSPDGKFLASGGNDNLLMIWDAGVNTVNNTTNPVFTFNQHQAAVKVCNHFLTAWLSCFHNREPSESFDIFTIHYSQ